MSLTIDELHRIIMQGEGGRVEFKREMSEEVAKGFSTDICAFANSQGGRIIFGVTDDREPVGCELSGVEKNRISQAASECRPAVQIDIEEVPFSKKTFLIVTVPSSSAAHSDKERRFPVRIGSITDYLDALGLVTLLQERSLIQTGRVQDAIPAPESKRECIPDKEAIAILRAMKSKNGRVRVEALMDLKNMVYQYAILEHENLVSLIKSVLTSGSNDERRLSLDVIYYVAIRGTESEKIAVTNWLETLTGIAGSSVNAQVAGRAFEILVWQGNTAVSSILANWILDADEVFFSSLQLPALLQNIGSHGLKSSIREAMYDLLEENSDERIAKRVSDVLETVRRSYG